ncbi:MAG: hypothetical protein ACRCZ9_10160 [Fusobacteriaceae bacterium]
MKNYINALKLILKNSVCGDENSDRRIKIQKKKDKINQKQKRLRNANLNKNSKSYFFFKNIKFLVYTNYKNKTNNISDITIPDKILNVLSFGGNFVINKSDINTP